MNHQNTKIKNPLSSFISKFFPHLLNFSNIPINLSTILRPKGFVNDCEQRLSNSESEEILSLVEIGQTLILKQRSQTVLLFFLRLVLVEELLSHHRSPSQIIRLFQNWVVQVRSVQKKPQQKLKKLLTILKLLFCLR